MTAPETDPQATTTDPPPETTDPGTVTTPPEATDPDDAVRRANAEAAQRRRQLRETEQERDQLRAQIDTRDRADVERLVADRLADPRDLWAATELADLRDDDGGLDQDKLAEAVGDLLQEKPHYAKPSLDPAIPLIEHAGPRAPVPEPPSFGSALKKSMKGR